MRASYYSEFCIQVLFKISIAVILLLDNSEAIEILIITTFHILPNLCLWWRSLCSNLGGVLPEKHHWVTIAAKHRAESFDFCLLILFLEDSAVFSLYSQTVVPVVPIYFYALVAVLQLVSTIHTNILIQQVQWCIPLLLLISWTLYRYSNWLKLLLFLFFFKRKYCFKHYRRVNECEFLKFITL